MLPPRTSIVRIAYEVYSIGCANAKKGICYQYVKNTWFQNDASACTVVVRAAGLRSKNAQARWPSGGHYNADRVQYGRACGVIHSRKPGYPVANSLNWPAIRFERSVICEVFDERATGFLCTVAGPVWPVCSRHGPCRPGRF